MHQYLLLLIFGILLIGCQDPASQNEPDNSPPVVSFDSPEDSILVSGSITVSGTGSDNQAITKVQLFLDDAPLGIPLESVPFSYQWETSNLPDYTWHTLSATARDAAGNTGSTDTLNILVDNSVSGDPAGLTLFEPADIGKYSAILEWESADTSDFIRYELYRNEGPLVTAANTLVLTQPDPRETQFTDNSLSLATQYAYRLYHTDSSGTYASNLVRFTTQNIRRSDITGTTLVSEAQVDIAWKKSPEPDFERYALRRDQGQPVTDSSPVIAEFTNINKQSHSDTTVQSHIEYFYRIDVVDARGNSRGGRQDSIITNVPPDPVTIRIDTFSQESVTLTWNTSLITDFKQYEIYSGTDPGLTRTDTPVGVVTNQADTTFSHQDIGTGVTYYYRLFVVDQMGLATGSNVVSAEIAP